MVTANEESGETVYLIKFDGRETTWHEWSFKTLQPAKSKCFRHVYAKGMKPIDNDAYLVSTDDDEKKKYEWNNKAYQLLILSVSGIAFEIINLAKTDDLMDGDAFLVWQYLENCYGPHQVTDLIQLTGNFKNCTLESTKADPDVANETLLLKNVLYTPTFFIKNLSALVLLYVMVITNVE